MRYSVDVLIGQSQAGFRKNLRQRFFALFLALGRRSGMLAPLLGFFWSSSQFLVREKRVRPLR